MDGIGLTTLILTSLNICSNVLLHIKLKHINLCGCIESDCYKTQLNTPITPLIKRSRSSSAPPQIF